MTDLSTLSDADLMSLYQQGSNRGVRNNNPLNLEATVNWSGMTGNDGRFATFGSMEEGFAAADQNLQAYANKHGINTVSGIINRWAPPTENDSRAYAATVAGALGVNPDDPLDMADPAIRSQLVQAMARVESPDVEPYLASTGPDISSLSDDELKAMYNAPRGGGEVEQAEFTAAPAAEAGPAMGDGSIYNPQNGRPYTEAQTAAFARGVQAGSLDPSAKPGSEKFPLLQVEADGLPDPGQFYMTLDGQVRQVPGGSTDPLSNGVSMGMTALNLGMRAINPMVGGMIPDARAETAIEGAKSGVALGGKNEISAALAALGNPGEYWPQFLENLQAADGRDAEMRAQHPNAWNAGAVAGGLASGVVTRGFGGASLPGQVAANAGLGSVSGALSADGGPAERGLGALIGGGVGAALPFIGPLVSRLAPYVRGVDMGAAGAAGNEALERAGASIADLPPEGRAIYHDFIRQGLDPAQSATIAAARSLPTPVPLDIGQVTGQPADQLALNLAQRGASGNPASAMARVFRDEQGDAIRSNVDDLARRIAGGDVPRIGEGAAPAAEALRGQRETAADVVNRSYARAREEGGGAVLPQYDGEALIGRIVGSVRDYDRLTIPAVWREVERLAEANFRDMDLKTLFDARSRLTNLRVGPASPETSAAGAAVREYDRFITEAMTDDFFTGDPSAVQAWRDAIGSRRRMGEVFEAGDLVEALTEQTGYGGARRLAVDPSDAANYIFGRSNLGWVGKQNLHRDLVKVRGMLGEQSPEWNTLRAEVFNRLADQGQGAFNGAERGFSGVKFSKAWQDAQARDARLVNTLFSQEERSAISHLAAVAAKATSTVKGGDNAPNTAVTAKALGLAKSMFGTIGKVTPILNSLLEVVEQRGAIRGVQRATQNVQPQAVLPPVNFGQAPGRIGGGVAGVLQAPEKPTVPMLR
jgi:hypothetical protein